MQLKKIAIVFLVVIMMFSLAAIGIAAEEADSQVTASQVTVSAKVESENSYSSTSVVVKPGDIISYVVSVEATNKLTALNVNVKFDNEALELQETVNGVFGKDTQFTVRADVVDVNRWGELADANGTFFTLKFKVNENFDGAIDKLEISYALYNCGDDDVFNCTIVDASAVEAHNLGDAVVVPGTCVKEGATEYRCAHEGCDYVLSISDGKLGDHTFVKVDRIEPTEEKAGIIEHQKCSVCYKLVDMNGKEITDVSIPKIEKPIVDIDTGNPVVTIVIIVVAVLVVAAGAVAAVVVLKKKKIL